KYRLMSRTIADRRPPHPTLFPYTTLFRSQGTHPAERIRGKLGGQQASYYRKVAVRRQPDAQRHSIEQPLRIKLGNAGVAINDSRSEEHTSELQSRENLVCRPLLEKKNAAR